jgi:uncharacterized cupredoxin-like copper-binding protein
MSLSRLLVILPAAGAALAISACGGSSKSTSSAAASTGKVVKSVAVKETEFRLAPSQVKVSKTGVVQVTAQNAGTITHALEVNGPNGETRTQDIAPGKSATLKVDLSKPGTYQWYCPIDGHKGMGMKGQIVVAGGGSGGSSSGSSSSSSGRSGY